MASEREKLRLAYSALDEQADQQRRTTFDAAALATNGVNPDVRATSMKLGAETGVPAEVAERNPAELEIVRLRKQYAALSKDAPQTASWLSDPSKMAVAKDDTDVMGFLEDVFTLRNHRGARAAAIRETLGAVRAGTTEVIGGVAALGQGIYGALAAPFGLVGQAEKAIGGVGYANAVEDALLGHARTLEVQSENITGALPRDASLLRKGVRSGLKSVGQQVPGLIAAVSTGNPAFALGPMVGSVVGQEYQKARDQGLQPMQAATYAAGQGTVEYVTEKYPLGLLLKGIDKSSIGKYVGSEVAGEQVATLLQDLNEWATLNPDKPFAKYIEERPNAAAETLVATLIGSGGNIAVVQTMRLMAERDRGTQKQQQLDDMVKLSSESKLRTRASAQFEDFTRRLSENSDVKQVFLPVDKLTTFFQSENIDPVMAAEHLTDDAGAWAEAQVTGRLQVPVENFLSRLEPEYMEALAKDALLSADQMTKEEQADWDKNSPEIIKAFTEAMGEAVPTEADASGAIYDDVYGQLTGLGVEASVAEKQAQLTQAVFRTLGTRTGVDGLTLYQRYGLKIANDAGAALKRGQEIDTQMDPLIDRLRTQGVPEDRDLFGPSLMEMLREVGLQDTAGELKSRDVDKDLKPFQRKLVRDDGMTLDDAAQLATERGFLQAQGEDEAFGRAGIDALLEAIDAEMRGEPKFSQRRQTDETLALRENLMALDEEITRAGLDIRTASNAEIKKALTKVSFEQDGIEFRDALNAGLDAGYTIAKTDGEYEVKTPEGELIDTFRTKVAAETVVAQRGAKGRTTLFQGGARGRIDFNANRQFTVTMLAKADPSTFLHEMGHMYLEVFADLATSPDAPQQIKDDWAATLKYLGVESRVDLGTDQHEKWARSFEAYLAEGRAPSPELKSAFARFRAWLVGVYRSLRTLNVEMTPEIRDVMDRLVATDDEIAAARHAQVMRPMFKNAKQAGMTEPQYEAYIRLQNEARVEGENAVASDMLKYLRREATKAYRAARKRVEADVTAEVDSMNDQKAVALLSRGTMPDGSPLPEGIDPIKLDRAALVALYGEPYLKRLPRPYVYAAEGGVHPDIAAGWLGFASGDRLVEALANVRPRKALIKELTDLRMREVYPDPATDGSLAERAMRAVHNSREADVLQAEAEAFARLIRESGEGKGLQRYAASQAVLRAYARTIVANKRVRDLNPSAYLVASQKSARLAMEAAGDMKWDEALAQQERRRMNYHLYVEARRTKDRLAKVTPYMRRFTKTPLREKIGKAEGELLERIDVLVARLGIRPAPPNIDVPTMRDAIKADIRALTVAAQPSVVAALDSSSPAKSLTTEQVLGLRSLARQYEVMARQHYEARVNGERVIIDEAADEMAASASGNGRQIPMYVGDPTLGERAKSFAYQALLVNRRITDIARSLDGESSFGAWTQRLIVPIRRAIAEKVDPLTLKARQDMAALYRKHYSLKELGQFRRALTDTGLDFRMTQDALLSLALNWGNEGNRKALLAMQNRQSGGPMFTEQKVQELLGRLSERDWAFVQDTWDYLDSYWPSIRDTEKRRRGIAPQKIQASPFTITTSDGKKVAIRGGYYPLRYDARTDVKANIDEIEDFYKKFQVGGMVRAATRAGATIERIGSGGRGVYLSLNVINAHLNEIIRDVSLGDEINYAAKVLNRPQVRQSLIDTGNYDVLQELQRWLQDAATGEMAARHAFDRIAQFTRTGFVTSKLAWSVTTTALQLTGIAQSMAVVGSDHIAKATVDFAKNPAAAHRLAMEQSAWLRDRYILHSWNKDVSDTRRYLQSVMGGVPTQSAIVLDMVTHSFFWPIMKMQQQVDVITWFAAYQKAQAEGVTEHDKAVLYADALVEKSQTSGQFADRSAVERGTVGPARQSKALMLFTALISYQLAKANIAYSKSREFALKPSFMGAATLSTDIVLLYAIEAILAGAIRGRLPDEDDDEGWGEWILGQALQSFASGVVFLREGVSALYGGGNTPIGSLANDVVNVYKQSAQGDVDAAMIKAYNNVGGQLFHYPSAQINRAVDAYWADKNGEDVAPYEYLTGPRD